MESETKQESEIKEELVIIEELLPKSHNNFDQFKITKPQFLGQPQQNSLIDCMLMTADSLESHVEVKNEAFSTLKACPLDSNFRLLVHLNLSMNKISIVDGGFECTNLKTLIFADNLIKEITPSFLQKCPQLRILDMSLNQITRIQNLPVSLTELILAQNRITGIEGLSQCTRLQRLNLSFNKITKIEGLTSLVLLEFLELGKNEIANADLLLNPQNHFCLLTELYLYINKIRKLPTLSFPSLKILNLNRNPDLLALNLGYCPMIEQISVSYCCL